MITKTSQKWTAGQTVKVGFMTLVVKAAVATPGDGAPDAYLLANQAGTQLYKFVPHSGCSKVSVAEARELMNTAWAAAQRGTAQALAKARRDADAAQAVGALFCTREAA